MKIKLFLLFFFVLSFHVSDVLAFVQEAERNSIQKAEEKLEPVEELPAPQLEEIEGIEVEGVESVDELKRQLTEFDEVLIEGTMKRLKLEKELLQTKYLLYSERGNRLREDRLIVDFKIDTRNSLSYCTLSLIHI